MNTLMIQEVLVEASWKARLTSDDRRGLTPLVYQHVSPYGVFDLDLTTRLPLREPVLAVHSYTFSLNVAGDTDLG